MLDRVVFGGRARYGTWLKADLAEVPEAGLWLLMLDIELMLRNQMARSKVIAENIRIEVRVTPAKLIPRRHDGLAMM